MRFEFIKEIKQPLVLFFLTFCVILPLVLFIGLKKELFGGFYQENRLDTIQVEALLMQYEKVDVELGDSMYQGLVLEESLLARQYNSVLFDEPDKFKDVSYELESLKKTLQTNPDYDKIADFQAPAYQTEKNFQLFSYLKEHNQPYILKPVSIGAFLIVVFSAIGVVWFAVCAALTSRVLEDDLNHSSIIKGQPYRFSQRMFRKFCVLLILSLVGFLLIFITSLGLTQFYGDPVNDFSYKEIVYLLDFVIINYWQWLIGFIIYLIIMLVFTFLLSILFNQLTKNFSLTLLLELALYVLTLFIGYSDKLTPAFIGYYLMPTALFEGRFLSSMLNPLGGTVYLSVASILLIGAITMVRKVGTR